MSRKKKRIRKGKGAPESLFSYGLQKRKRKSDWAGITLGDAFKHTLDYYLRMSAQRLFYKTTKKVQMAAAKLAVWSLDAGSVPCVKPQLGSCYTTYPSRLAAFASIGLTAYLEFETRTPEKILHTHLAHYVKNASTLDGIHVDPGIYQRMAGILTGIVQTRLLLEDLSRSPSMAFVELYRLFAASQQNMSFRSVPELLNAVILYGDILPDWNEQELHPVTRSLLKVVTTVSYPFFERMPKTESHMLVALGSDWVRSLNRALARFLPLQNQTRKGGSAAKEDSKQITNVRPRQHKDPAGTILGWIEAKLNASQKENDPEDFRFGIDQDEARESNEIAPLNGPNPPSLFDPETASNQILENLLNTEPLEDRSRLAPVDSSTINSEVQQVVERFSEALRMAGEQINQWEDMRSDIVERTLRNDAFTSGPMEGSQAEGHEVEIRAGDLNAGGEIFDRPLELSEDFQTVEALLSESQPIADALRRVLYPNIEHVPQTEELRTNGSIDPSRLALIDVSQAVFQRYRIREESDRRGRPVLLIACDGSGSLDHAQMKMAKLLVTSWLTSTVRTQVQVLAGLYHSGEIRAGLTGPLVQWMYHPLKTATTSRREAVCALASLPDVGTGVQSDALSIAFMLQEARRIARNRMIYLILITDCQWNCSFPAQEQSGHDEVYSVLEEAYNDFQGKLHVTLVALGAGADTGFEYLLDKVIPIPDFADPAAVANQVGGYVASCIQERKKILSRK